MYFRPQYTFGNLAPIFVFLASQSSILSRYPLYTGPLLVPADCHGGYAVVSRRGGQLLLTPPLLTPDHWHRYRSSISLSMWQRTVITKRISFAALLQ